MPSQSAAGLTIGVVFDIPEPHSSVLTTWRHRSGDLQAGVIPPHVTLLPPFAVSAAELDVVEAHLSKVATLVSPFAMHLAGTGSFRPITEVVFVRVAAGVEQCETLAAGMRSGPLYCELDYPYHPHVTVAHDVSTEALDDIESGLSDFVARFPVGSFTMYERGTEGSWRPRQEYPLGG